MLPFTLSQPQISYGKFTPSMFKMVRLNRESHVTSQFHLIGSGLTPGRKHSGPRERCWYHRGPKIRERLLPWLQLSPEEAATWGHLLCWTCRSCVTAFGWELSLYLHFKICACMCECVLHARPELKTLRHLSGLVCHRELGSLPRQIRQSLLYTNTHVHTHTYTRSSLYFV